MIKERLSHPAIKISLIYLIISTIWIIASDAILLLFFSRESQRLTQLQNYKGLFFISFTSVLIYILIKRYQIYREKYEKEVVELKNRYESIFENNASAMLCINPEDGQIVEINKAAELFYGYPKPDFLQKNIADINIDLNNDILERIRKADGKQQSFFQFKHKLADGTIKDVEVYSGPVNFNGKRYLLSIIHDISDLRTMKNELIKNQNLLEQQNNSIISINQDLRKANEELDNFVYRVSHDLRAPITSSLGLAILTQKENDLAMCHQYAKMQEQSLVKLDKFIKDILDYSRNTRIELVFEEIDIQKMVQETIDLLSKTVLYQHINVEKSIQTPYPIVSDYLRLKMILNNLINNAFRFHNKYANEPFVKIKLRSSKDNFCIFIEDNGIGIKENHLDEIFKMFYRATDINPGSGIGLYIVQDCINKLNGTIEVLSEVDKGTSFKVTIPNKYD